MTDDMLDEKIKKAFDNVHADDSVKARIKKGIKGDNMENTNITLTSHQSENETTQNRGKAAVRHTGRITAAAVAAVVAVGGSAYLLKGGFDRVDDKPQSKSESKSESKPESADSYAGSASADLNGFFDPMGYTLYDKFGKNADIWRLNSGNFLVRQVKGDGAEYYQYDGQEFCYMLYDGNENAVTKEVKTDGSGVYVYDDCFVTWSTDYGKQDEYGVTVNTTMTCTIYDTDLEVVRDNVELKLDHEDPMGAPIVGADNKLFYAGMSYDGEKNTMNVYKENGEKISDYSSSGLFSTTTAAVSGNYMYFLCAEEEGLKPQVQALNDGYLNLSLFLSKEEAQNCLLYSAGDTVYMAYPDENGKLTVSATPVKSGESTVTSYEATFPLNVRNSNDCYVTGGGKFLFVAAPMTDNAGVDIYVYDLEDTSAEAKVFSFEGLSAGIFADGRNVLFDEASGDVCIGGFTAAEMLPSARQDTVLTFNLYTDEYTNFGIKHTDGGNDSGEEQSEASESELNNIADPSNNLYTDENTNFGINQTDGGEEQSETSESELNYIDDPSNINAVNAKKIFNMVETAFSYQYSVGSISGASLSFNRDELAEAVKNGFDISTVKGRLMKALYAQCEPTEIDILNTDFEVIVEIGGSYVAVVIYEDDTHTGYYSYPENALEKLDSIESGSFKPQIVPDVTGLESEEAQVTLLNANFNVVLKTTWDENVPENCIASTDPGAGTVFPEGSNVTLYISKGPRVDGVKVPNVIGLTPEVAATILKENKLTVNVKEIPHDGDKGTVIDQSAGPDKKVDEGTEVNIYVSTGEAPNYR